MKSLKQWVTIGMVLVLTTTGCAQKKDQSGSQNRVNVQNQSSNSLHQQTADRLQKTGEATYLSLIQKDGKNYVAVRNLADVLQFQSKWNSDTQTFWIGDNDVNYSLSVNAKQAQKAGEMISLSEAPIFLNGQMVIPVSVVADLFQDAMNFEIQNQSLVVHAASGNQPKIEDTVSSGLQSTVDNDLRFEDDNSGESPVFKSFPIQSQPGAPIVEEESVTVFKKVNLDALVRTANSLLGVPYVFGAAPYPRSGAFDCSSFTQYVFGKYGISLQRTAAAQAKQGFTVSRKMLRKGDLVFFYVPGRFKSNNMVGHNGIYIGNGKMIHTYSPKNGVQISNMNTPYWQRVFLFAKRVTG